MQKAQCPTCGVWQDPEFPICLHMAGRKGGRKTVAKHGRKHFEKIGHKGGKWKRGGKRGALAA